MRTKKNAKSGWKHGRLVRTWALLSGLLPELCLVQVNDTNNSKRDMKAQAWGDRLEREENFYLTLCYFFRIIRW